MRHEFGDFLKWMRVSWKNVSCSQHSTPQQQTVAPPWDGCFYRDDAGSLYCLDLIIDEVLFGEQILRTYINALKSHKVYFIGVFCDLQTLLEREILRRDRAIGLANGQMDRVHAGIRDYDLKVDATTTSSFSIAKDILAFIDKTPAPEGFQKMQAMF